MNSAAWQCLARTPLGMPPLCRAGVLYASSEHKKIGRARNSLVRPQATVAAADRTEQRRRPISTTNRSELQVLMSPGNDFAKQRRAFLVVDTEKDRIVFHRLSAGAFEAFQKRREGVPSRATTLRTGPSDGRVQHDTGADGLQFHSKRLHLPKGGSLDVKKLSAGVSCCSSSCAFWATFSSWTPSSSSCASSFSSSSFWRRHRVCRTRRRTAASRSRGR